MSLGPNASPLVDTAERVRDGLFLAASRTYAEQYIEPLVRAKYELAEPSGDDHDAVGPDQTLYEIKASKVMRRRHNRRGSRSLLERVLFEVDDTPLNRYFDSGRRHVEDYDANIQNVKRDHFDVLIYVLLFKDCLMIFETSSGSFAKGLFPNWSAKHGRYDEEGKSGQFPISKANIAWHEDNTLIDIMSYFEAAELLESSE